MSVDDRDEDVVEKQGALVSLRVDVEVVEVCAQVCLRSP